MPIWSAMELPLSDVFALKSAIRLVPRRFLARIFTLEGLASVGGNLLMYGIFFYMHKRFGWGARKNLLLSSAEGIAYVIGALAANPLSHRIDRQQLLRVLEIGMVIVALAAACFAIPLVLVVLLLGYTMLSAAQWPLMESLISVGTTPAELSRRISIYNLVWSGTGAMTVAACGVLIARFPQGIFLATAAAHLAGCALLLRIHPQPDRAHAQLLPDPELIPLRKLAKRLSRIVLPATFAVIYALGAIMPTLPVIQSAHAEVRTLLAGVWMIARWLCFVLLGATAWWHTRPRALLAAAVILLAAFLGVTLIPSVLSMILWQLVLGAAMGLIYSASLYFGMVLSDGSTAQNAYHEALIGVGCILGPGCGALASQIRPGDPHAAVLAVAAILWISIMAACVVSLQSHRPAG
ncbi:MAG: MFS transporter [Tepidisphaeraceae bacterium]